MTAKIVFQKNGSLDAYFKVIGDGGGEVELTFEELCNTTIQELPEDLSKIKVTILGVQWSGEPDGIIRVFRGDDRIMTCQSAPQGMLQFDGQQHVPENHNQDKPFRFSISGTCELWMRVRKNGYLPKEEFAWYGAYDDPDKVGAKTDVSGSPDYDPQGA